LQVFLITGVYSLLKTLSLRRTAPAISRTEVKGQQADQLPPPARTECLLQTRRVLENPSRLGANQSSQAVHETGCVFSNSHDWQNRLQRNSFQEPPPRPPPRSRPRPRPADLVSRTRTRTIGFMVSMRDSGIVEAQLTSYFGRCSLPMNQPPHPFPLPQWGKGCSARADFAHPRLSTRFALAFGVF